VSKKIDKYYKYLEVDQGKGVTAFGWVNAESIDEGLDYVLSYSSKSKKVSEEDSVWSEKEGCSATNLVDYSTYVERLTGQSPQDFYAEWQDKIDSFEISDKGWREGSAEFILNLCELILGKKNSFTQFGRIYKRVNVTS
jgi:hypothetical protein